MRWALESWSPDYSTPMGEEALGASQAPVDVSVEVGPDDWAPRRPAPLDVVPELVFVDGVRRVEGFVWVTDADGSMRQGIVASYAAGVVQCQASAAGSGSTASAAGSGSNGRAAVVDARVERSLFCEGADLEPIVTRHGRFDPRPVSSGDPQGLSLALQGAMADLESEVARASGTSGIIVVDGPLRDRRHLANAIGYVKTHHVAYLPPAVSEVVPRLEAGERTPVFTLGERFVRYSWYLRLPGPRTHGWAGVVRCEVGPELPLEQVVAFADLSATVLPRFASEPHKDPRAPQNLYPIAGLERELRRRLGDRLLIERALRAAVPA
jgi:hypothetical protein